MKKLFFLLLFIGIVVISNAQITITAEDMPEAGDSARISTPLTILGFNYEDTGENYTWDFSDFIVIYQVTDTYVAVSSTPSIYQLIFTYPSVATIAKPGFDFDLIPDLTLTNVYEFYRETEDFYSHAGIGATLNDIPLPMKLDQADILYNFPLNYKDKDTSYSSFEFGLPGLGFYSTNKQRMNDVDGWGELITPFGNFEVLRVKSDIIQHDSVYIDTLGFGFPINREYTEYRWLANGFSQPLLEITQEGLVITVSYMDSVRMTTSINNIAEPEDFKIYPNPANDYLKVELLMPQQKPVNLFLYSENGSLIFNELLNSSVLSGGYIISLKEFEIPPGIYFVVASIENKFLTKKIIVN